MDIYNNFQSLKRNEKEDVDFGIEVKDRGSEYAIIAIHGGSIEPFTTEIAKSIAGENASFYSFIGMKKMGNRFLHITSNNFDEPKCVSLIKKSYKAISIHGKKGDKDFLVLGGLDENLISIIFDSLTKADFNIIDTEESVSGKSENNICNRCKSEKGVQLEISRGLRAKLAGDRELLNKFSYSIRSVLS